MHDGTLAIFCIALTTSFFSVGMWIRAEVQRRRVDQRLWQVLLKADALGQTNSNEVPAASLHSRRFEHLESQVDQLTQQIDRLAETQEFLSRVLTDRIDHLPDPRMRTPH